MDPIVFCLTRRDFSLFRFFVSYNLLESSRCLAEEASVRDESQELETLVLFGYEKTGVPPTTYSLNCTFSSLIFQFLLDEEESENKSIEGMMDVICSNAAWSLIKDADCISKQSVNVDSIRLTQTSNRIEWLGFPDLLLPITAREDQTNDPHRLFQFTSITHPNGNNVKMLHLDAAGIYLIVPAWQHVVRFFQKLATSPEVFTSEEMTSIMQVGDRFYRVSSRNDRTTKLNDRDSTEVNNEGSFHQVAVSKQFLVTLASPQIILVADASVQGKKCPRLTLSMSHLNILRQTTIQDEINSVFCDGLEIFTETASGSLPRSSVICPVHISGSLRKSYRSTNHPQSLLGWVWIEELFARASYTDLTLAIDVLNGTKEQLASPETAQSLAQPKINKSLPGSADEENREVSGRM